jgi:hypothetical protein
MAAPSFSPLPPLVQQGLLCESLLSGSWGSLRGPEVVGTNAGSLLR